MFELLPKDFIELSFYWFSIYKFGADIIPTVFDKFYFYLNYNKKLENNLPLRIFHPNFDRVP